MQLCYNALTLLMWDRVKDMSACLCLFGVRSLWWNAFVLKEIKQGKLDCGAPHHSGDIWPQAVDSGVVTKHTAGSRPYGAENRLLWNQFKGMAPSLMCSKGIRHYCRRNKGVCQQLDSRGLKRSDYMCTLVLTDIAGSSKYKYNQTRREKGDMRSWNECKPFSL